MSDEPADAAAPTVTVVALAPGGWAALGETARELIRTAPLVIAGHREQTQLPDIAGQDRRRWPTPWLPTVQTLLAEYRGRAILLVTSERSLPRLRSELAAEVDPTHLRIA